MAEVTLQGGIGVSWCSFSTTLMGVNTAGINRISLKDTQAMQNNYGMGRRPYNRTLGKIENEGSVTMFMDVVWALIKSSPTGRLQDIPEFEITYRAVIGTESFTYVLKYCRFMENSLDISEGDMNVLVDVPLIIGEVEFKVGL